MKSDIFYLRDSEGAIVASFKQTSDYSMEGAVRTYSSWTMDNNGNYTVPGDDGELLAEVYCKWDSCTHWNFFGEDFVNGVTEKPNAYYHLCGSPSFMDHIRAMCFVWAIAPGILSECIPTATFENVYDEYFDSDKINELVEFMLKDYTIEKVKKDET